MLLRVVAVLACAAYAAAVQCVKCVGMIEDYHLDPHAVCYHNIGGTPERLATRCEYAQPHSSAGYYCDYNDKGESIGGWSSCPKKADIADADDCLACTPSHPGA